MALDLEKKYELFVTQSSVVFVHEHEPVSSLKNKCIKLAWFSDRYLIQSCKTSISSKFGKVWKLLPLQYMLFHRWPKLQHICLGWSHQNMCILNNFSNLNFSYLAIIYCFNADLFFIFVWYFKKTMILIICSFLCFTAWSINV